MPGTTSRNVHFASTHPSSSRPARDDEVFVMKQFAGHASHCHLCCQPYSTFLSHLDLCPRGQVYAKDVSQYVYSKGGKAFSVVDRKDLNQRVQIEIPRGCDVIKDLLKAVDNGMVLPKHKPVITQEPHRSHQSQPQPQKSQPPKIIERRPKPASPTPKSSAPVPKPTISKPSSSKPTSSKPTTVTIPSLPRRRDSVSISRSPIQPQTRSPSHSPSKRDSGIFITGRGSLYRKDEVERRRRDVEIKPSNNQQLLVGGDDDNEEPIIIRAAPGVRVREYHG